MTRIVDLFAPGLLVAVGQFDFHVFPDVHSADAFVAHVVERVLHGFPLRIENGFFGCDNDFCFHASGEPQIERRC